MLIRELQSAKINTNYFQQRFKFIGSHYLEIRHCWAQDLKNQASFLCLAS